MDPSLKEKQAFFKQLETWRSCDEEADTLDPEEQALRQQCQAFRVAASVPTLFAKPKLPGLHPRRTALDLVTNSIDDEVEIIAVTPIDNRSKRTKSLLITGPSVENSIVPETEQQLGRKPSRRSIPPSTRVLRSQSDIKPSPSVLMAKRKRSKPLQMASESQQIFKGLSFYYIPNDDINPARKLRITKAREHGAIWAQNLAEATHIVVDKNLSYADIKPVLDGNPNSSSIVLVNDRYPIDCLARGVVFDPGQTLEKPIYQVTGVPKSVGEPTIPQSSTQDSSISLQFKSRRDAQPPTQTTSELSPIRADPLPSSRFEETHSPKENSRPPTGAAFHADSELCNAGQAPIFADELMNCIDAVLDDPEKHEYLDESDPDGQGPEKEGPSKRTRRSTRGQSHEKNGVYTEFGQDKFICMRGGTRYKNYSGHNADTIKLFEEMAEEHSLRNETFRVQSYRKAVATLRRQPKNIITAQEAVALPNIGSSLANHIEEIVSTGRFRKLDQLRSEPSRQALRVFCNVYGVGTETAKKWVELGYRTLDDLQSKAKLSVNQRIGVEHYDDLLTRIPRAEVTALGDYVKEAAFVVDPDVKIIVGGSYRRGSDSSGDIDLIVTKGGTSSTTELGPFLDKLVDILTKRGFLTAALASHRHQGGNKWHGCCVLPEAAFPGLKDDYRPIWRRIDFLLVPETEIGAALIYFTGNDLFNRSIRLLAHKKKMKLNHKALSGAGVHEGRDEKKIFEILGVNWREPHERWC
ncbi:hypothetical protein F5Y19DRAFT_406848 [Xylariaceae sp. FL1651]|nr:hypothetical protein F5Y19DRAFT_406848 [Xylariaceae sp. FL1651]